MHAAPLPFEVKWVIALNPEETGFLADAFWSHDLGWIIQPELAMQFVFFEEAEDYIRDHSRKMGLEP